MKAGTVMKIGDMQVIDVPMPEIGEYEVLCELLYGATCSGTDIHVIYGCPWNLRYPLIPGHESVGKVVECGKKVKNIKIGDIITRVGAPDYPELGINSHGWGGYAEYGIGVDHWAIEADNASVKHNFNTTVHQIIPDYINPVEATLIITLRETLSYIKRLGMTDGMNIIVIGSGANGFAFCLHSFLHGAADIIMIGNGSKRKQAELCGATDYYDYKDPDIAEKVKSKYNKKIDVIIDAIGNSNMLRMALPMLKNNGTFGIYGNHEYGGASINPFEVRGSFRYYGSGYDEVETHFEIIDYYRKGKINASAFIDTQNIYPLDKIAEVFTSIKNRTFPDSKAVFKLK